MEAREDYSKIDYTIHKVVHGRSKGCKVLEIQFALLCGPIRYHLIHHGRVKRSDTDTAPNQATEQPTTGFLPQASDPLTKRSAQEKWQ